MKLKCPFCGEQIDGVPYILKEGLKGEIEEAAHIECWFRNPSPIDDGGHEGLRT